MKISDGYIIPTDDNDGFIVWGDIHCDKGYVAKGFSIEIPNVTNASNEYKNSLFERLANYLAKLPIDSRLQVKYEVSTDYEKALEKYRRETEEKASHKWDQLIRTKVYNRFKNKIKNRQLRREKVYFYISTPLSKFINWTFDTSSPKDTKNLERAVTEFFDNHFSQLKSSFLDCNLHSMNVVEMYEHLYTTLNKSALNQEINFKERFQEEKTILENTLYSEYKGFTEDPDTRSAALAGDGFFHNIMQLDSTPRGSTRPFFCNDTLLSNNLQNYSITVNLQKLDTDTEITKKQAELKRVTLDREEQRFAKSLDVKITRLSNQIDDYSDGNSFGFMVDYIIHIWNPDPKELVNDTIVIRNAADQMNCKLLQYELGAQSLMTFVKTFPGNLFYKDWANSLEIVHNCLASILPFSSSFTGFLDEAMALYDGDSQNLIGITSFVGGSPQHASTFGQSGAGKSVNEVDLLSQTHCFFDKVVIIEDGASYLMLTQIYEGEFIVIDPNGSVTINYFDTCGSPLTKGQISFIESLLTAMCGISSDDEINIDRQAIINPYIKRIYNDKFKEWSENNVQLRDIARICITIEKLQLNISINTPTDEEAFLDVTEIIDTNESERDPFQKEIFSFYEGITDGQINDYILEEKELLKNISFAYMNRNDFPTHGELVDNIRHAAEDHHDPEKTSTIANRLERYEYTGPNGCLFDGHTNINLKNPWIHIELGRLKSSEKTLKSMVGIIMDNLVKNTITSMKRSAKKLYIFEEAAVILTIPGADEIMKQSYAQFRKYNCQAKTICQQMDQLWESKVSNIICTQSKQLFLLKNKSEDDLRKIQSFASSIPDHTLKTIMEYPLPEHMRGEKYSSMCFYNDCDGGINMIGTIQNHACPEVVFAAGTSGDTYAKRERQLKELSAVMKDADIVDKLLFLLKTESDPTIKQIMNVINQMEELIEKNGKEKFTVLKKRIQKILKIA